MPNSQSSPLSGDICICIEGISARSPQQRERYAQDLAEISVHMCPLERMAAMKALERMVENGNSASDFVRGIYAYGEVASGQLPASAPNQKPPSRSETISTVIRLCGLEWAEKFRERDQVLRLGTRAIQSMMKNEPMVSACAPILDAIRSGNTTQKILALRASQVLDLNESEVVLAAAKATFDPDHSVCLAAEEAFRKISRFGHRPLRGIILESKEPMVRRAVAGYIQEASKPDITFLSRAAIYGYFSGHMKAKTIIEELVERSLLKPKDIEEECGACPHASSRKMGELHQMVSQKAFISGMLGIPDGIRTTPMPSAQHLKGAGPASFPKRRGDSPLQSAYRPIIPLRFPIKA